MSEESYQTEHRQGQEGAAEESSVQEEENWADYTQEAEEQEDFEAQESQEGSEEQEAPASSEGEEQAPAQEEQQQEQEAQEESTQEETSEEQAQEEPQEEQEVQEEPQEPQFSPEEYQKKKEESLNQLQERYKLDDETADKLLENPNEVLPRLMAQAHIDAFENAVQAIQGNLPSMVQQYEQQKKAQEKAENEFFSKWPKLKGYESRVEQIAAAYRQVNPNVTREQFIQDVGAQAHWALGIPVEDESPKQEEKAAPYQPASPGTTGAGQQGGRTSEPQNEFEEMILEDMEDE